MTNAKTFSRCRDGSYLGFCSNRSLAQRTEPRSRSQHQTDSLEDDPTSKSSPIFARKNGNSVSSTASTIRSTVPGRGKSSIFNSPPLRKVRRAISIPVTVKEIEESQEQTDSAPRRKSGAARRGTRSGQMLLEHHQLGNALRPESSSSEGTLYRRKPKSMTCREPHLSPDSINVAQDPAVTGKFSIVPLHMTANFPL